MSIFLMRTGHSKKKHPPMKCFGDFLRAKSVTFRNSPEKAIEQNILLNWIRKYNSNDSRTVLL